MSGQFDPRITAYFGDAVLQAGFMPVPNLFLRHYARLGITTPQAMFLLQLMAIAWDVGSPPTNMTMLAERMGVSRRAAQLISAELAARGLVEIFDQYDDQGAQVENGYDLGPLFQQLAALAPAPPPPGQPRRRQSRDPRSSEPQAVKNSSSPPAQNNSSPPAQSSSSPPAKKSSRPPGTADHPAPEARIAAPAKETSQLKKETKNRVKKQLRKNQEQQPAVAETHVAQGHIPGIDESDRPPKGVSLRWECELTAAEISRSRQVLARIGLNSDVADAVAPTLHPAECWSLWTYARSAGLGSAWIAQQVYDPRRRVPRIAGVPGRYDDAGRLLATLPSATAEKILDITDESCPRMPELLRQPGLAAELALPEPELRNALDTIWNAFAGERSAPGRYRPDARDAHPTRAPALERLASADVLRWPAVCERLMPEIAPDDWSTWLAPLALLDIVDGVAVIGAPNLFVRSEVSARFTPLLAAALTAELGQELRVELVIATPVLDGY